MWRCPVQCRCIRLAQTASPSLSVLRIVPVSSRSCWPLSGYIPAPNSPPPTAPTIGAERLEFVQYRHSCMRQQARAGLLGCIANMPRWLAHLIPKKVVVVLHEPDVNQTRHTRRAQSHLYETMRRRDVMCSHVDTSPTRASKLPRRRQGNGNGG